jgi:hypothetical protein
MLDPCGSQLDQPFEAIGHDPLPPRRPPKALPLFVTLPVKLMVEQVKAIQVGLVCRPLLRIERGRGQVLLSEIVPRRVGGWVREQTRDEGVGRERLFRDQA